MTRKSTHSTRTRRAPSARSVALHKAAVAKSAARTLALRRAGAAKRASALVLRTARRRAALARKTAKHAEVVAKAAARQRAATARHDATLGREAQSAFNRRQRKFVRRVHSKHAKNARAYRPKTHRPSY